MEKLDERIEEAVQILWVDRQFERGEEAIRLFMQAAEEGNPDAYYFLARCYAGPSYVERGFHFADDDEKVKEYLDLSIEKGSALGMFGARRFGGYKPKGGSFVHEPYRSSKEIWDKVCAIADTGEIFTQYLVANAYYYGDVAELTEMDFSKSTKIEVQWQFRRWAEKAIEMYEDLIAHNMMMGVGNYIDIITSGDFGIPKDEKKAEELMNLAASKGNPYYMVKLGRKVEETQPQKAAEYFQKALDCGYTDAGYYLGRLYTFKGAFPRDLKKAKELFEKCIDGATVGCHNLLGEIYFYGGDGIEPDYNKAFEHLLAAHNMENYWGSDMLGTCYLKGLGTNVDYVKAKEELSRYTKEALSSIGLGEIYAYGLGVPVDIKKGMEYWDRFPNHQKVIEHKKNFKKTLFGWKQVKS